MSLLNFVFGKRNINQDGKCQCQSKTSIESCDPENARIWVLGSGCQSCHTLFDLTQEAVKNLNLDVQVAFVDDLSKIAALGIMSLPAIAVDQKVVSAGRKLRLTEVEEILKAAL